MIKFMEINVLEDNVLEDNVLGDNVHGDNGDSIDEQIAQQFIRNKEADLIINVLDASSLERGLYLTSQLFDSGIPDDRRPQYDRRCP